MTCYSPMTLYPSKKGINPETGKIPLTGYKQSTMKNGQRVPCGKCIGCHLEWSRQWAVRCMAEKQTQEFSEFITLTYRDDALVYGKAEHGTLVPRDLELFWKRLRKAYGDGIRYFACGEYGDKSNRPHYHAIVYGCDIKDKKYQYTKNGSQLYSSDTLDNIWTHGSCIIGDVTFESVAYVARYILKKAEGKTRHYYESNGIEPEFVRMSRRPGLGLEWLKRYHKDVYPNDKMVIRNGVKVRPPRYFDLKMDSKNPQLMEQIRNLRKINAEKVWQENEPPRLKIRQRIKKTSISILLRNQIN